MYRSGSVREGQLPRYTSYSFCLHTSPNHIYITIMKQANMFHKDSASPFLYNSSDDNQKEEYDNPLTNLIASIQNQQQKRKVRLPRNNISDPMGLMIHNFIKFAGANSISTKKIISLLSNKGKYDQKLLSNVSDLLYSNRLEPLAIMFVATEEYYCKNIKPNINQQQNIHLLKEAFKNIAYNIIKNAVYIKIKSMAQEFHASFCDPELKPHTADDAIIQRFNILKQQLQHQIDDKYQFEIVCPCLRHNLSPPCKIKNCPWPHICRCGAIDHVLTNKICPKYNMDDDKFNKQISGMNWYHSKKNNKTPRYDRWNSYSGKNQNTPSNDNSNNKRNDNVDNRYSRHRR